MGDPSSARNLIHIGDIINLVIGVLVFLVIVVFSFGLGIVVAWIPLAIAIWTHLRAKSALELIDEGRYKEAKDKILIPAILSLIFNSLVGGLIILLGAISLPSENASNPVEGTVEPF
ncbi:hypothetical protein [Thermococcus pacificus]|uniref:Uncharacterized protein n=1 Tax=Thermococcus pacificus TaxID=71998 RepID=A0A218P931_9EURY|nr:hypothetical protein [Thermococcus pacificus]ASJ07240.1 hypothetical protein A3L08_07860 [Thermococcus pacificus]